MPLVLMKAVNFCGDSLEPTRNRIWVTCEVAIDGSHESCIRGRIHCRGLGANPFVVKLAYFVQVTTIADGKEFVK